MLRHGRYALPKALREFKVVCAGADKPLVAAALLQGLGAAPTLVFTASVEATRRWVCVCACTCMP
jgi:ATP-dependent RNA helicase DDX51/DBP6